MIEPFPNRMQIRIPVPEGIDLTELFKQAKGQEGMPCTMSMKDPGDIPFTFSKGFRIDKVDLIQSGENPALLYSLSVPPGRITRFWAS